ncbi:anhydro-N-acetylmuramic acid kinase [Algoriphagus limi]|uniref:Anhydro-N-acetylmuramic acid kinase n=1 Tax=Algoriphagus limi TaxID=2975273 RepID=A0ABT2G8K2_9BACT|nr:anhydro-N-acetylmuramic acid kinase [Algoriphagus limi]MCS5491078.1 anhydro-N-acetylmuramic acid kinase [Algoriphagus limi]
MENSAELIGLMSGTSGDGLDIAYCRFEKGDQWSFKILHALTKPFPKELGTLLQNSHLLSSEQLTQLDVDFGAWMGTQVRSFCEEKNLNPLAVCSHGHTVFHQPAKGYSLQIGNGWALHRQSGFRVVNDFRMLDVQLGGQGAPLVPIGDKLLFGEMDFCLNLGGIANISMEEKGKRLAFDTCPFNLLLNPFAEKLGAAYDDGGEWASEGKVNSDLLSQLNNLPYYERVGAKSLGREDMEKDFFPLLENSDLDEKDILATLVEHYAIQISQVILQYTGDSAPRVLITGGGAYHEFFISRLDFYLESNWEKAEVSSTLIEFKEALVFAFLGYLRILGINNVLSDVTGAGKDSCSGVIYG